MNKKIISIPILLLLVNFVFYEARGDQPPKSMIKYKAGEGIEIETAGLNIGAGVTFVAQGTPNANNTGEEGDGVFDASYKANVEIEKEFDDWGLAFLELEAGQNDTIEGELSLFSNVNADAADSSANVAITKFFYEHYLFDKQLMLGFGKYDASDNLDQNKYAACDATQFLCRMFKHSPVVEFPADNALGARMNVCFEPVDFLEFELGCYEADADWDDIFDHTFYAAQVNLKPAQLLNLDENRLDGNYRFYWWINDQNHTKLVEEGELASDDTKETNYGFGLSCDQMLTNTFGVFGRFGWQRPGIIPADEGATLDLAWSAGGQAKGIYWNREGDVLGFAIGQVFPSKEYKDAGNPGGGEGHIETYYRCQINECLAISPDVQLIWHPNGVKKDSQGDKDVIFVYGVRGEVGF